MFDHADLKWLAANTTELNRLLQQVARSSEQARQYHGEEKYLELLEERVDRATRVSQALFDRITARILSASGGDSDLMARAAAISEPTRAAVKMKMPVGEIIAEGSETPTPVVHNPGGKRELILLVDDDPELLETTTDMLDFEDYRVIPAKDGVEALQIYRQMKDEIALVILDYFLPVMDGDVVFEELKAIDPDVRVVLSSGFGEQSRIGTMLAQGLRGFMPKPYTHERLIEQVRLVLDA